MPYSVTDVARVVHEANRALQVVNADPAVPVGPPWDDLDAETRASATEGVVGVLVGATPEQSHAGWCEFKRAHGWTYGPVKDETARTHPCLVDYADLAEGDRVKDALFCAVVHALAPVEV